MNQVWPWVVESIGVFWLFGLFSILKKWLSDVVLFFCPGVTNHVPPVAKKSYRVKTRDSKPPTMAFDSAPQKDTKYRMSHREWMQIAISIVMLAVGFYVLLFQDNKSQMATGYIGTVIGFWFKQK